MDGQNDIEITHYSATQQEDENQNKLPNFLTEWPENWPFTFLDPQIARDEAEGMVIDRQKRILYFQYDETSKEIDIMENKMEEMNKDLTYLKQIWDKVGWNLELLGLQVDNIRNKEKQAKP